MMKKKKESKSETSNTKSISVCCSNVLLLKNNLKLRGGYHDWL